ncbi:unnamed protein product [Caenorhabditis bovis]|uniref:Uncharacterized protein n=1 Tax=Caenorhabditis bovis TaxID=2654633 RepID=A0A8S1FBU4_9PELO|nr:unnamed protein product [Caenorhabditis bovis]
MPPSKPADLCHFYALLDTDAPLYETNSLRPYSTDPMYSATLPRNYGVHMDDPPFHYDPMAFPERPSTVGRAQFGHIIHNERRFATLEKSRAHQRMSKSDYHLMMDAPNQYTDYDTIQRMVSVSV